MHTANLSAGTSAGATAASPANPDDADFRLLGASALARALRASRADTLATFAVYEAALAQRGRADMAVPYSPQFNPPLWELGHIGWFQAWWLGRNPERSRGVAANPDAPRRPAGRANADALYNSSLVPHASRWSLPLPDAAATRADLLQVLEESVQLLAQDNASDTALYFHRLALAHEDMHHEAAVYMAQALGIAIADAWWQQRRLAGASAELQLGGTAHQLGSTEGSGFVFDNECGQQVVPLANYRIDSQVLRWRDYLPFVEAGGYRQARWWPGPAAAWRATQTEQALPGQEPAPRYLRREGRQWQHWRHGQWQALDLDLPACHLSAFEADAWCAWAGRRLPTEAEWEHAALSQPGRFAWGEVWEWTASTFEPFAGFAAHPYRDYSAPWFGSRRVLRGASVATQPRMHHARYRNFFTPERNDIFAGLRTCAA